MKVLIATHHYFDLTGSETFAYTLAKTLMLKGCNVTLYSPYIGGVITDKTLQLGIRIFDNLEEIKREEFDVISLSHNLTAIEVRLRFPYTPMIFLSHGVLPFLEQPPLEALNISKYLAVSEEVKSNLLDSGIPNEDIVIFRNIIDTQRFFPFERIHEEPKSVLVNSRRMDRQTKAIIAEACKGLHLEMKVIGNPENIEWDVERHINQVDICISLGRGILEAMSCGRAAIVFDYNGWDGLITANNIDEIQKSNFSGRRFKRRFSVETLIDEIQKYANAMGRENRRIVEERFSAEKNVDALIDIYRMAIDSFEPEPLASDKLNHLKNLIVETRSYSYEIERRRSAGLVRDKESAFMALQHAFQENEQTLAKLNSLVTEKDNDIEMLKETINEREAFRVRLEGVLRQGEIETERLRADLAENEHELGMLRKTVNQKNASLFNFGEIVKDQATQITTLEEVVRKKETEVENLKDGLAEKEREKRNLKTIAHEKTNQISHLEAVAGEREAALYRIYHSDGWKALLFYYRLRDKIFPPNSNRTKVAKFVWNFWGRINLKSAGIFKKGNIKKSIFYLRHYGIRIFFKKVWSKLTPEKAYYLSKPYVPKLNLSVIREEVDEVVYYEDAAVSIVIPTKNAGSDFGLLLSTLREQKGLKDIEIIVVDSGSSDETVETAKTYGARIIAIPPEKFSHSHARNVGAENGSGKYLFFTVQDALPPSRLFIYELFSVLKNNDVAAVSCAEFPRNDIDLFYSVLLWNHYKFLEVDRQDRILSLPETQSHLAIRKNGQLSDLACLIPKDLFMNYKYQSDYAEDLHLGIRLIKDGYKLAFLGSIRIIHSHNRPPYYFLKRGYVDNLYLTSIFPDYPVPAMQGKDLVRDITCTYHSIHSFIQGDLSHTKTPIGVEELFDRVHQKLGSSECPPSPSTIEAEDSPWADRELRSFLKEISDLCDPSGKEPLHNGTLLCAVSNFMKLVKEYMSSSYTVVDDEVLADFKALLVKGFALQCGAYLAYCYLNDDSMIKSLHGRLKEGI